MEKEIVFSASKWLKTWRANPFFRVPHSGGQDDDYCYTEGPSPFFPPLFLLSKLKYHINRYKLISKDFSPLLQLNNCPEWRIQSFLSSPRFPTGINSVTALVFGNIINPECGC